MHFAVRQRHLDAAPRRERRGELGRVQRTDGGIGHQQDVARGNRPGEFVAALHGAGADEDRIAAKAEFYVNALHLGSMSRPSTVASVTSISGIRPGAAPP